MTTNTHTSCRRLNSLRPFYDEFHVSDPIQKDHHEGRPLEHVEAALPALHLELFASFGSPTFVGFNPCSFYSAEKFAKLPPAFRLLSAAESGV